MQQYSERAHGEANLRGALRRTLSAGAVRHRDFRISASTLSSTGEVHVVACIAPEGLLDTTDRSFQIPEGSEALRTLRQGRLAAVSDIEHDERSEGAVDYFRETQIRAAAVLPLQFEGNVVGTVAFSASTPREFGESTQRLLRRIGELAQPIVAALVLLRERDGLLETVLDQLRSKAQREQELATAIHDTNNFLTVIAPRLQYAERDPQLSRENRRHLRIAQQAIHAIAKIQAELRGRRARGHSDPAIVIDRLEELLRSLAGRHVNVVFRTDAFSGRLAISEIDLTQALSNLVKNAAEAFDGGPGRISIELLRAGDRGLLVVADNGPGIDPRLLPHVLEPGVSTKGPDRGLGLSSVRDLVRAAGGRLEVRSSDAGTTFVLDLPAAAAPRIH
ncbi:MAG: ATP-binding protein [Myxococcota bacterium]